MLLGPWTSTPPIYQLENSTFEQQKRKELSESSRKPGYMVPCLLWFPGLPWLHLDLDSPARAAEVEGTLRKTELCHSTIKACYDLILASKKVSFAQF